MPRFSCILASGVAGRHALQTAVFELSHGGGSLNAGGRQHQVKQLRVPDVSVYNLAAGHMYAKIFLLAAILFVGGEAETMSQHPASKPLVTGAIRAIEAYISENGLEPVRYSIESISRPDWENTLHPDPATSTTWMT